MTDPKTDIDRLQQEMDQARTDGAKAGKGEVVKAPKNQSLDAVVTGAGMLLVLGLAVGFASRLTPKQVTSLTAGSVGASAGLVFSSAAGGMANETNDFDCADRLGADVTRSGDCPLKR